FFFFFFFFLSSILSIRHTAVSRPRIFGIKANPQDAASGKRILKNLYIMEDCIILDNQAVWKLESHVIACDVYIS
ncbi:hypothetical protein F5Y11DRAFT_319413, partial [Daldinia sp. FL1419]